MTIDVGVGGAWKDSPKISVGVGGVWKTAASIAVGVGGVWKTAWQYAQAALPASLYATDTEISPTDASAFIEINTSGAINDQNGAVATWLTAGTSADFQVYLSGTGDTPGGSALNTWITCNTSPKWTGTCTTNGFDSTTFNGTLQIRETATGTVVDSCSVTIEAVVEV